MGGGICLHAILIKQNFKSFRKVLLWIKLCTFVRLSNWMWAIHVWTSHSDPVRGSHGDILLWYRFILTYNKTSNSVWTSWRKQSSHTPTKHTLLTARLYTCSNNHTMPSNEFNRYYAQITKGQDRSRRLVKPPGNPTQRTVWASNPGLRVNIKRIWSWSDSGGSEEVSYHAGGCRIQS